MNLRSGKKSESGEVEKKIKVAHVLTNIHDGGIEKVVFQIASNLSNERFDVRVFAIIDRNPWVDVFRSQGIPVVVLGGCNRFTAWGVIVNLRAICKLSRELRKWDCDVVNVHDFFPGVFGRISAWIARVPRVIATLHNTYSWFGKIPHLINRIFSLGTDNVVAVSKSALAASMSKDRIPTGKYTLILNGVDPAPLTPNPELGAQVRRELGIERSTILIGNVGTHSIRKDQRTLLCAAQILVQRGLDVHIVIVGSIRDHEREIEEELQSLSQSKPLKEKVSFLVDRHDMHRIYQALDVYCMPSITEGLSLASIEAMMAGCVVVYSDIEPFVELVENGVNGYVFPVGNQYILADVIEKASAMSDHDREKMKLLARESVIAKHGLDEVISRYDKLYSGH